jgi:DNA-binding NtrC family response regulator
VLAFPRALALPVPFGRGPVGREWLDQHGAPDGRVSGRHFAIGRASGTAFLEDAGSRNGTWLDGRRLAPGDRATLVDGAVIRFGRTLAVYREELEGPDAPSPPIGELIAPFGLRAFAATLEGFARVSPRNVLIEGETGTGKELAARAVAAAVGRARPYVAVNLAGIPATVFESQLFGHVAGAFSDARQAAPGVVRKHDGGTVFLDEIGELPLALQPKLLRLLENREVHPVGADRPVTVDVLLVAATNRSLEDLAREERFRADLLARLASARVELPPLRERAEDVYAIAEEAVRRRGAQRGAPERLDPELVEVEAVERLLLEPWPANVRGLVAAMDRVAAVDPAPRLRAWAVERVLGPAASARAGVLSSELVDDALAACGGNETQAARRLGVTRGKLRRFRDLAKR